MMMPSFRRKALAAAAVLASLIIPATAAATYTTEEFTFPGTGCNTFGNTSLGPSGGPELVNRGSSTALVECPFPREAATTVLQDWTYLDVRGSVTCYVRAVDPSNGSGWAWGPDSSTFPTGYTEYFWGSKALSLGRAYGASLECFMNPGAVINNYRVEQPWLNR
jgi:hypothetical protein